MTAYYLHNIKSYNLSSLIFLHADKNMEHSSTFQFVQTVHYYCFLTF
jgi:hypothetical protein